jgi:hypothetical protein
MKPKTSRRKLVRKSPHQELVRPALPGTVNLGLLRRLEQNEPNVRFQTDPQLNLADPHPLFSRRCPGTVHLGPTPACAGG